MSDQEVLATYQARAPRYRALPGLVDKYYLRFDASDEHGAVYVWQSPEALAEFRASELATSMADALQVVGAPEVTLATLVMHLRESEDSPLTDVGGQSVFPPTRASVDSEAQVAGCRP
jgi:hypothetical protein